jgi:hypothetical protein
LQAQISGGSITIAANSDPQPTSVPLKGVGPKIELDSEQPPLYVHIGNRLGQADLGLTQFVVVERELKITGIIHWLTVEVELALVSKLGPQCYVWGIGLLSQRPGAGGGNCQ